MSDTMIIVRRPKDHPKGPKTIAVFPYGSPVPPGVIIGKGSVITIETKGGKSNGI
jgi:hypothetical protein